MAAGIGRVLPYSLHSLKVIRWRGRPDRRKPWHWYRIHIGRERCPIVDTWWQTETGAS